MAQEIKTNGSIGTTLRRYCRSIHSHLSFVFVGMILVYALSGITMNHLKDYNPQYMISVENYTTEGVFPHSHNFDEAEIRTMLEKVGERDNYTKHFYPNRSTMKVFLKSGSSFTVNTQTGEVNYEGLKKRPVFYQLSFLHYNPGKWWTYFSDIFAVSLILICVTGVFMNKGRRGLTGIGGIEMIIGIVVPILFLLCS